MNRFAIIIAAIATTAAVAHAEDFSGKCTDYSAKGKDGCVATQWCVWREGKALHLPDGTQFSASSHCAFKPNFKAAYAAKTTPVAPKPVQ